MNLDSSPLLDLSNTSLQCRDAKSFWMRCGVKD